MQTMQNKYISIKKYLYIEPPVFSSSELGKSKKPGPDRVNRGGSRKNLPGGTT